ncbi:MULTISPECIES: DUF1800 family protein [Paraburkholderia]|uniref:DUF1800 domain-containing protein n=1 Tax=Paraburkholderia TaxID=1822464 RepID=UPI00224E06CA|nr:MULTISPECIES: DUF1800 domain-containing protein [Paraburkholderia]MCX4166206.1 DUF1800 domain-containing protein [Paraburkholderia megapolitana]MDN7161696.1 DUF1800 domain-containing protein [Paraburkholderia sp. CHISQ3]MDQ6498744.1 DUF1800 domain-containing protein [Paraburkholderia megapolitana]
MTLTPAAIALNRFGLGARPEDTAPSDPHAWLAAQFDAYQPLPSAWANQPTSVTLATDAAQQRQQFTAPAQQQPTDAATAASATQTARRSLAKMLRVEARTTYRDAVTARISSALTTPTPFIERLVHFWSNHFAVSVDKGQVAEFAGAFEVEAIRPHVLGRFEDMLIAVERHPAMQLFLDQTRSIGPDSTAAMRAEQRDPEHKRGLNENLAREIMELHTLGVRSGYTQADVTEFARALTGWSIATARGPRPDAAPPGSFIFRAALHEPGPRVVLGRRYDEPGEDQAQAILKDLAGSHACAMHIAGKLACHFVADTPPPHVVTHLANAFERSGGDLPTVYRALLDTPEAWSPAPTKFKTPWEWAVSSLRGLGWRDTGNLQAAPLLAQLGEPVWRPGSPAGYDDIAASWAAPDALVRRVELAQRLAARTGDTLDPNTLGDMLLPGSISEATRSAVARAESTSTALALLLVSPDFQRR